MALCEVGYLLWVPEATIGAHQRKKTSVNNKLSLLYSFFSETLKKVGKIYSSLPNKRLGQITVAMGILLKINKRLSPNKRLNGKHIKNFNKCRTFNTTYSTLWLVGQYLYQMKYFYIRYIFVISSRIVPTITVLF